MPMLPAFSDAGSGSPGPGDLPPFFAMPPQQPDLRGPTGPQDFGLAPPNPAQPAPASQPGLLSRLARGYGAPGVDPLVSEWLSPEQKNYLQSQGQAGLAASLLQASGPAPRGTQNFASRLGGAMQGGLANWRQMQQEYLGRTIQSILFGWEMQARQMLQDALKDNPPEEAGASPAAKAGRLARVAARLATAGPIGAQYAKEYAGLAKSMLEASPMSAKEQTDEWNKAIGGYERGAHALEQYRLLEGKTDRISIAQRAKLAAQIVNPDKPDESLGAYEHPDVWETVPLIGKSMAAAMRMGQITPEDARQLDANVKAAAQRTAAQADRVIEHQKIIGENGALGRDWRGYYNPFREVKPARGSAPRAEPGRPRNLIPLPGEE